MQSRGRLERIWAGEPKISLSLIERIIAFGKKNLLTKGILCCKLKHYLFFPTFSILAFDLRSVS